MSQPPYIPQPPFSAQPIPPAPAPAAGARQFSYVSAIVRSPYSKELWRDVGQNWRGIGLLYMLLLLTLTWLPVVIVATRGFYAFLDQDVPKLVNQVPNITIANGVVSIDKPQPYYIYNGPTKQPFIIIDTTGETTALPSGTYALLTRNSLITRQNVGETRTMDLSSIKSLSLDTTTINNWIATIRFWFFPAALILMILLTLAWRLILMVIGGAIAMALASPFRAPISFPAAMRLAAIAMTPGILLSTLISLSNFRGVGCFGWILGIGLFVLFLCLALHANASDALTGPRGFPIQPTPNLPFPLAETPFPPAPTRPAPPTPLPPPQQEQPPSPPAPQR